MSDEDQVKTLPDDVSSESVVDDIEEELETSDESTWVAQKHEPVQDDRQTHFILKLNPYEGTASLEKEDVVDREALIAPVELEPSTSGMIVQLFKSIDVDKSGELTVEDFEKLGEEDNEAWKKIQKHFDEDGDGSVTKEEFRTGFKGFGVEACLDTPIGFEAPYDWTLDQWVAQVQSVLNKSVTHQCKVLGSWVQQFDGLKSELSTAATPQEISEDTMLMGLYLNGFAEQQIHKLYGVLDRDENGVLESADFAVMSKNSGTSSFWEELKANFDVDGDECITLIEFKQHIATTVASRFPVGSIPSKDWTWRQVIGRLTEWANRMVQQQCREIFDYFAFGEYGTADSESAKEAGLDKLATQFGAGTTLSEPAFPGGEPVKLKPIENSVFAAEFAHQQHNTDQFVPATFANAETMGFAPVQVQPQPQPQQVQQMPPPPHQMPSLFPPNGNMPLLPPPPPVGMGMGGLRAWWLPATLFQMQDHMSQMDQRDIEIARSRRDARFGQTLDMLRQMAL